MQHYSPYQLNLGPNADRGLPSDVTATGVDNPFSPSELERLLRPYDVDSPSLPPRLAALTGLTGGAAAILKGRLDVTTDSWDWPGQVGPIEKRVTAVLKKRLTDAGVAETAVSNLLPQVLPPELFVGLKMNVNRPFGNGRDDSAAMGGSDTYVVDGPSETTSQSLALSGGSVSSFSFDGRSDYTNANLALQSPTTSLAARQLMARYLYVMVFTLGNRDRLVTAFGDADAAARAVAQWAVNVVDFRDRDNDHDPLRLRSALRFQ